MGCSGYLRLSGRRLQITERISPRIEGTPEIEPDSQNSENPYKVSDEEVLHRLSKQLLKRVGSSNKESGPNGAGNQVGQARRYPDRFDPSLSTSGKKKTDLAQVFKDYENGLRSVQQGLKLYWYGLSFLTVCFTLNVLFAQQLGPQDPLLIVLQGGHFCGLLMILIGEFKCTRVPRDSGARYAVWGSVFFYGSNALLQVVFQFVPNANNLNANFLNGWSLAMKSLPVLLSLIALVLFLTFMVQLTLFLQNDLLYRRATKLRRDLFKMITVLMGALLMVMFLEAFVRVLAVAILVMSSLCLVVFFCFWIRRFDGLVRDTAFAIKI